MPIPIIKKINNNIQEQKQELLNKENNNESWDEIFDKWGTTLLKQLNLFIA